MGLLKGFNEVFIYALQVTNHSALYQNAIVLSSCAERLHCLWHVCIIINNISNKEKKIVLFYHVLNKCPLSSKLSLIGKERGNA